MSLMRSHSRGFHFHIIFHVFNEPIILFVINFLRTESFQFFISTIGFIKQVQIRTYEEFKFFVLDFARLMLKRLVDAFICLLNENFVSTLVVDEECKLGSCMVVVV